MLRLPTVIGVCVLTLLLLDVTFASLPRCNEPQREFYPTVCTKERISFPRPRTCNYMYSVSPVSNDSTCTYTNYTTTTEGEEVNNTVHFNITRAEYYFFGGHAKCFRAGLRICWTVYIDGSQGLRGFLLTVAEETLNSVNISRWFNVKFPSSVNATAEFCYSCIRVRQMATHTIRLYTLPHSPNNVATRVLPPSNQHACVERSYCFNPIVVASAFDHNASIVVSFTTPPQSLSFEGYFVSLVTLRSNLQVVQREQADMVSSSEHADDVFSSATDKSSTVLGVQDEQPNAAADGGWVSNKKTAFEAQSSQSLSQHFAWSWQTVVVTTSSIVVLLFVAFLAVWKLHQSTRMCGGEPLPPLQSGITDEELVTSRSFGYRDSIDQLSYVPSYIVTTDEDGMPKVVRIIPPSDLESVSPSEIDNRLDRLNVDYDSHATAEQCEDEDDLSNGSLHP